MSNFAKVKICGSATVGERGQVVIPAGVRKSFKIKAGDKFIVFAKPDMIGLVPTQEFSRFLDSASQVSAKFSK